jgi:transcriptional regulator with XRE-family HTH domain
MDDQRLGVIARALRRRRGWRQIDLASAVGVSQPVISRIERGHLDTLSVRTIRRVLSALDIRLGHDVRWRGGELDRVVDARHSRLLGSGADQLVADGWQVMQEVTYAHFGERGSVDLIGVRELERAVVILEIKSELYSWEETQRRFDQKIRLLPDILQQRLGWRPKVIGKILLLEASMTNRRRIKAVGAAARHQYPGDTRAAKRWLKSPVGELSAIWFLSLMPSRTGSGKRGGVHRVRAASRAASRPAPRTDHPRAKRDAA